MFRLVASSGTSTYPKYEPLVGRLMAISEIQRVRRGCGQIVRVSIVTIPVWVKTLSLSFKIHCPLPAGRQSSATSPARPTDDGIMPWSAGEPSGRSS